MHGHHQMFNTKLRLIIFFADEHGEALYSQQKLLSLSITKINIYCKQRRLCITFYFDKF